MHWAWRNNPSTTSGAEALILADFLQQFPNYNNENVIADKMILLIIRNSTYLREDAFRTYFRNYLKNKIIFFKKANVFRN